MSVHSTHYEDEEEFERDLAFEYRRERYEQAHGPEEWQRAGKKKKPSTLLENVKQWDEAIQKRGYIN